MTVALLWYASIALKGAAAVSLYRQGLHKRYPALFVLLTYSVLKSLALVAVRRSPWWYAALYLVFSPLNVIAMAACGIEAFMRVCEHYPGFQRVAQGIIVISAVIGGVAGVLATNTPSATWSGYIAPMLAAEKYVVVSLFAMLAGALILVPRYSTIPVRLSANANACCLLLYLAGTVTAVLLAQQLRQWHVADLVTLGSAAGASLGWIASMTKASDVVPRVRYISDEEMKHAQRQIRTIRRYARRTLTCCR